MVKANSPTYRYLLKSTSRFISIGRGPMSSLHPLCIKNAPFSFFMPRYPFPAGRGRLLEAPSLWLFEAAEPPNLQRPRKFEEGEAEMSGDKKDTTCQRGEEWKGAAAAALLSSANDCGGLCSEVGGNWYYYQHALRAMLINIWCFATLLEDHGKIC